MSRVRQRVPARLVVGARSVARAVCAGGVRRVYLAVDAPAQATEPVRQVAREHRLPVQFVGTAAELGRRCGIERPVAAAAERTP